MSGTDGSFRPAAHGFAVLPASVDLQSSASGAWVDSGLSVTLPSAGVYHLDANVRGRLQVSSADDVNVWVVARLRDTTAGAVVPYSEIMVQQIVIRPGHPFGTAGNQQAPILIEYATTGPAVLHLEAARHNTIGATTAADIRSDVTAGRTTLRFRRVA